MYVVRIVKLDGGVDFKAFTARPDATKRFDAYSPLACDKFESVALFEVPGADDARAAVEAVKSGRHGVILLDRDRWPEFLRAAGELIDEWVRDGKLAPAREPI